MFTPSACAASDRSAAADGLVYHVKEMRARNLCEDDQVDVPFTREASSIPR